MDSRERSLSPSDYSEWLHHPLTPPAEQHVPTLFDGTAHLVERRNRCRDAFIRSQERGTQLDPSLLGLQPASPATSQSSPLTLSQSTATQSQQRSQVSFDPPGSPFGRPEVPIGIEFVLFPPKPSPPPVNPCKRRTVAAHVGSQHQKAESEPGKLVINWDTHNYNLERFKAAAINSIQHHEDECLGSFARERKAEGRIVWNVIIPNGRTFAAAQKRRLDSAKIFTQFLQVAEGTPESRKIICRLVQKDPTLLAQKELVYKHLRLMQAGPSSAAEDPSDGPSAGAQAVSSLTNLVQELACIHKLAQHLTGSHETGVFINPKNPNEFFQMTPKQIALWAKAIRHNPSKVTLRNPPKSDSFQFKTKEDQPQPPPQVPAQPPPQVPAQPPPLGPPAPVLSAAVQFAMPPGMFFNPMHLATSMALPPLPWMNVGTSQNLPGTPEAPATPPDSSIEDFLKYAHVNPESPQVVDGISALGITHWTMFKEFKASELVSHGIPEGPARSIVSSAKKYAHHLMSTSRNT